MSSAPIDKCPRKVLLFSGHMIDLPGRIPPRFPTESESIAAGAIAKFVSQIEVGREDLAISSAACGGDLLFAEACLAKDMQLELYIPFYEPAFLAESVDFANADWRTRYAAARSRATLHVMPDELGPLPPLQNPYERLNTWMLDSASRFGWARVTLVCLWDGQEGDGPGGTHHFVDLARRMTDRIYLLDTRTLWRLK